MEKLKVGDFIRVKTAVGREGKDTEGYGTVVYEVVEVGLPYKPNADMEGVKFKMIGGSGPRAVPGRTIFDSQETVAANIKNGKTELISPEEAKQMAKRFEAAAASQKQVNVGQMKGRVMPGGGVELD